MLSFESFIETLSSGSGYWSPLVWGTALVVTFLIIYILRGRGQSSYKKGTEQTKVFLSGNEEPAKELMHVKGSNIYWGFTEALKWIYTLLDKIHNGNISDYILWFVVVMGIFFIFIGVI